MWNTIKLRLFGCEAFVVKSLRQANYLGRRRIPSGLRSLAGVVFIIGGFFGFLPVLGYWMIPVGLLLIAIDIPAMRPIVARLIQSWRRHVDGRAGPRDV